MGYIVQNRIEVSVFINDVEFPLDTQNILTFLHVGWSTRMFLPTFHMKIADVKHSLDTLQLQDAIPIRIVVKPAGGDAAIYKFRKFHHKKEFVGDHFEYEFDGYYDSIKFWSGTSLAGYRGTSSEVLSQLCAKTGLQFEGAATNDSQLWMQRNRTFSGFSKAIKQAGYIDDKSYMEHGIDPRGFMLYKNINDLAPPSSTLVLGRIVAGQYTVQEYLPKARSGMGNKLTGYQNMRVQQSMTGQSIVNEHKTLEFTPDSKAPLINLEAKKQQGRGTSTFSTVNVGNKHPNYERAIYQNQRYANLFSLDVEFLMNTSTDLTLFDRFTFTVETEGSKQDRAFAGVYTVVAKSFFISGSNYAEKILGTRTGVNLPYVEG